MTSSQIDFYMKPSMRIMVFSVGRAAMFFHGRSRYAVCYSGHLLVNPTGESPEKSCPSMEHGGALPIKLPFRLQVVPEKNLHGLTSSSYLMKSNDHVFRGKFEVIPGNHKHHINIYKP